MIKKVMSGDESDINADLLVLGGGPGGYTAAFRAADLGLKVVLVEQRERLGGVCLNVGCIPSKGLLHVAKTMDDANNLSEIGVEYNPPNISLDKLRHWSESLVATLAKGLGSLATQRKIQVLTGEGKFIDSYRLRVNESTVVNFKQSIVAVGSSAIKLQSIPEDERIMDSTGALQLKDIPKRLLVIGSGVIGLELASVYQQLGSEVTLVELHGQILPGCDNDLLSPLIKKINNKFTDIFTKTEVKNVELKKDEIVVTLRTEERDFTASFDRILVAVGRRPNSDKIGLERTGVKLDQKGFIIVDKHQQTNVPHIFAIGDVVAGPMLAHKASYEGKLAAEVAAGKKLSNDAKVIPSVVYTNPEIAWVGLTETVAKEQGLLYDKVTFPWSASGRAHAMREKDGFTKVLVDPKSRRILGVGIVGSHAGDLIAEATLAIEMGAEPGDVALTIHPHPTLSETIAFAAEAYEGVLTELYLGKEKHF